MVNRLAQLYESVGISDLAQIAILTVVLFAFLRFLGKSCGSGSSIGRGLAIVVIGFFLVMQVIIASLDMTELGTVLDYLLATLLIGLLIIFQPELRRGLTVLGRSALGRYFLPSSRSLAEQLAEAAAALSRERVGALIAIQREIHLSPFIETGQRVEGHISAALVRSIFTPKSPLHDGAIIVTDGRLTAAACQLPLGSFESHTRAHLPFPMGMRHRAALSLSSETDAVVLVVSEETGRISLAVEGRFEAVLPDHLARMLTPLLTASSTDSVIRQAA